MSRRSSASLKGSCSASRSALDLSLRYRAWQWTCGSLGGMTHLNGEFSSLRNVYHGKSQTGRSVFDSGRRNGRAVRSTE